MTDLTQLFVGGIPLLIVIFGLIEFSKSLGLKGKWLTVASLLLGVASCTRSVGIGVAYRCAQDGTPVGFAAWFVVIIFGLTLGLITSGFYDFVDKRFPKVG